MKNHYEPQCYLLDISFSQDANVSDEPPYFATLYLVKPGTLEVLSEVETRSELIGWSVAEIIAIYLGLAVHQVQLGCTVVMRFDGEDME